MKIMIEVPDDTVFTTMGKYTIWSSGPIGIMVIDDALLDPIIVTPASEPEPEPEPTPTPTPTPTPVETELYVVVTTDRLNVRKDHSRTADIVRRLNTGDEFPLIVGAKFDDTVNAVAILWRKLTDGNWVAVTFGDAVYAEKVDTSVRGG